MTAAAPPPTAVDVSPGVEMAERLFAELRAQSADGAGVTRMSYGPGEAMAHALARREAERLRLRVEADAACNLYMTLPGAAQGPRLVIGSHLDSVPKGGNYDGAAGVLMGLAVLAAVIAAGRTPPRAVTVMAIRAEESAWFPASYIGSRAAFGRVSAAELETVRRAGDEVPLGHAIAAAGGDAAAVSAGRAFLKPADICAFVEPHIEQGPVLSGEGVALGLVTEIRGSLRHRTALCTGRFAHSGTTPKRMRRDAVLAVAALVVELDALWERFLAEGHDLTVTVGQIAADPPESSFSKVCGLVRFSIDSRSRSRATLDAFAAAMRDAVARIEGRHGVSFDLGPASGTDPAAMHPAVLGGLRQASRDAGRAVLAMPCGAGHDAATFAAEGVPTGMLFLRNENGSHNPDEHLDMADFRAGTEVLARFCLAPWDRWA